MQYRRATLFSVFIIFCLSGAAQQFKFTRADSLRGALRPERTCYDVTFYDLRVKVDPENKRISGSTEIFFTALTDFSRLQIDLFKNMYIDSILHMGNELSYTREANAVFVELREIVRAGTRSSILVKYFGNPTVASRAPWDGGFVWKKDTNGKPWIGVACEGTGASLWWPNKDHLSDEPDSMRIVVTAPMGLKAVANGQQRSIRDLDTQWTQTEWFVSYPINNYNVTVNIADYAQIQDTFQNASGTHDLDYYVLSYNEEKARKHFAQVKPMMRVFEKHFGEYPFWKDGYALVETPYLGMEHQGAIAYGNRYLKGYEGFDPLNLGFDYIVIHESGHEWWGNSVSCKDHAELWIHESFCTYSEAVYVEALWDETMARRYLMNQRGNIANQSPIVGPLDVNFNNWVGSDMYYKGAWMLHTLRHQVQNDELWWQTIHDFALAFQYQTTTTEEIIAWFSAKLGKDYTWLFREYLYHAKPPVFVYKAKGKGDKTKVKGMWEASEPDFRLSIPLANKDGKPYMVTPSGKWQNFVVPVPLADFRLDVTTWYGKTRNLGGK